MKGVLQLVAALVIGLAISAGAVFGFHDRSVMTPPPESAAESFLDNFAVRRYPQALSHVAEDVSLSGDSLGAVHHGIAQQMGGGFHVESVERLWMAEERAAVLAVLEGENGERLSAELPLVRKNGMWRVGDLRNLIALAR